jgi:tellurite resistance protein TehA-like permease
VPRFATAVFDLAARAGPPVAFAMVMATGIVSAAIGQAGLTVAADALLAIGAAGFVFLLAAVSARAALRPDELRAELADPRRAFTSFAFVAACAVLASDLAGAGQPGSPAVLAATAATAWLVLTAAVPARLAVRRMLADGTRPSAEDVNGSWYLFTVATQALVITLAVTEADGVVPAGLAAVAAPVAWSAGVLCYLVTSVLVAVRLAGYGQGPRGSRAAYWVAMGAASISVLAAARLAGLPGLRDTAVASGVTTAAIALWALATALIPVLAAATAAHYLRAPSRPRYHPGMWVIVFPLGMYATASRQLGAIAGLPVIHDAGVIAAWPAVAAWLVTFTLMAATPLTGRPGRATRQGAAVPARTWPGRERRP